MDIGNLLAEADREVGEVPDYNDEFEDIEEPDAGDEKKKFSAAEILRSAAQTIEKEEKYEAKQLFKETANELKEAIEQSVGDNENVESERDAMNILIDASNEVAEMHREANVEIVSPYRKKEEIDIDEGLESDDEDEEFDDKLSEQLLHACHLGNIDKVEKLLDKSGVNLLISDRHGWTPLHWAAAKGHTDVMISLIQKRKDQKRKLRKFLEKQDDLAGWTPMHVSHISSFAIIFSSIACKAAAVSGQKHAIEILLEYGASKHRKDRMKEIPLDTVGKSKHSRAIIKILADDNEDGFETKRN